MHPLLKKRGIEKIIEVPKNCFGPPDIYEKRSSYNTRIFGQGFKWGFYLGTFAGGQFFALVAIMGKSHGSVALTSTLLMASGVGLCNGLLQVGLS